MPKQRLKMWSNISSAMVAKCVREHVEAEKITCLAAGFKELILNKKGEPSCNIPPTGWKRFLTQFAELSPGTLFFQTHHPEHVCLPELKDLESYL